MKNMILWTIILTTFWSCGKKVIDYSPVPETLTESIPLTSADVNSHIYEGTTDPDSTLGKDLDLFINKTDQKVYLKKISKWELVYTFPEKILTKIVPVVDINNVNKGIDKVIYLDLKTNNLYLWNGKDLELIYDAKSFCSDNGNSELSPFCENSDNETTKTSKKTEVTKIQMHIPAISKDFSRESVKKLVLPYLEKNEENKKTLDILFNNETNITVNNKRTVKNAQVIFEFDLRTIVKDPGELIDAKVALNIRKFHLDDKNNTEIICLLNIMNCSGTIFTSDSGFYKLLNDNFFQRKSKPMNNMFSSVLSDKADWDKHENTSTLSHSFSLMKLFNEKNEAIAKLISNSKNGKMSFVIADDIQLLDSPILILEYKK